MIYKNSLVIIITLMIFNCSKSQNSKLDKFEKEINQLKNKDFVNSFELKYQNRLKDSINKAGSNLYTMGGNKNEIYIQNVIFNIERDSLYVIAINKSSFTKNMFTDNENDLSECDFFTLVGIPIIKDGNNINFKSDNINIYKMFNNCNKKSNKKDLKDLKDNYSELVYEALQKTDETDFPKENGIWFFRKLYNNYYKKNKE